MRPDIINRIASAKNEEELQGIKVELLGKNGFLRSELAKLGSLPVDERKAKGLELNRDKKILKRKLSSDKSNLHLSR